MDVKFGIYTTVESPYRRGVSRSTKFMYLSMDRLDWRSNVGVVFGEIVRPIKFTF